MENEGVFINDTEKYSNQTAAIDIVIGSDYWGELMTGQRKRLPCGLHAFESLFGWTLSGVTPTNICEEEMISMLLTEDTIPNLWSLELLGIKDPIDKLSQVQEDAEAKKIFMDTAKRMEDGRYQINLPWIGDDKNIPNNNVSHEKLNEKNQFEIYNSIFKSWLEEGFIEDAIDEVDPFKCHYLPHRPIFKDSVTTPVRPAFDASCKVGRHPSLNDCLYKGPNHIEQLPDVLMRFRAKKVGALADIRKA